MKEDLFWNFLDEARAPGSWAFNNTGDRWDVFCMATGAGDDFSDLYMIEGAHGFDLTTANDFELSEIINLLRTDMLIGHYPKLLPDISTVVEMRCPGYALRKIAENRYQVFHAGVPTASLSWTGDEWVATGKDMILDRILP